ncbi:MAG: 16S rRNA (guanine(966)-N(2))-methyltransferase RsmD [Ruminococcaceae bacterium]|nr:16S rRNA (guanine(966)-N(2))-methyltransferase RsmD [Oscillospiraceae bacterium]
MRIISGTAKGRRLQTLPGSDVRPTSDKVKEGIFSAIQFDIEGRRFLDLFAGSGQMGLEALSRGALSSVFVDSSNDSIRVLKENIFSVGFGENSTVIRSDALSFLSLTKETFDIAFLDPPYAAGLLEKSLEAVSKKMSDFGIIICEHPFEVTLPESVNGFSVFKRYRYGKINVTTYKKEN